MAEIPEYHGSLVAFEGPQDIISTQLRLLPNSPKILILPSIQHFAKQDNASSPFDARLYILQTHKACNARTEVARTFLRESTPDNKRIVFMNEGTATAQTSCIAAIAKHETNGDVTKAENIFNKLVQNGILGLERHINPEQEVRLFSRVEETTYMDVRDDEVPNDPVSKAMRAADALDLETASLQSIYELDLTYAARPRSTSVPVRPMADELQNAAPFHVFGTPENTQKAPLPGAIGQAQLLYVEQWRAMAASENQLSDPNTTPRSPTWVGEAYPTDPFTPTSAIGPAHITLESMPNSPALLGEALLVDIRPSMPTTHKRIKSVDRIYASAIRNQDILLCDFAPSVLAKLEEPQHTQNNARGKESGSPKKAMLRSNFYSEIARPNFVKPRKTMVRKGPPSPLNLETQSPKRLTYVDQRTGSVRNHVHCGTPPEPVAVPKTEAGTGGWFLDLEDDFELDGNEPFQTVLPMAEDLVIHFKAENDTILEAMIQAIKNGTYPVSMPSLLPEAKEKTERPSPPTTRGSTPMLVGEDTHQVIQESMPIYDSDEYDPFASHGDYLRSPTTTYLPKQGAGTRLQTAVDIPTPPTPAQTPPPPARIYHDFDIKGFKTTVCIQDALRAILNIYFPPEDIGYHQFNFPLLPELSSFWRPVFREAPSKGCKAIRKIDLVLAIGADKASDRELLGSISGALEKLGTEPNGTSRSGRLDLRYLIANAVQTFTAQSLAYQTRDSLFSDPLLLATLIIPHLETYMAAHSATQFLLLEYPAEHLSTVLALQRLVGVDILKVAGIIDAEASEPKSYRSHKQPSTKPSFSKANFILTSTATESEIATLISTIWRILIDISPFYIPQHARALQSRRNSLNVGKAKVNDDVSRSNSRDHPASPSPLIYPGEQYAPLVGAAVMLGFAPSPAEQQPQAKQLRGLPSNYVSSGTYADLPLPAPTQQPVTPLNSSKVSLAETIRSGRTAKNQRSSKLRNLLGRDAVAAVAARGAENGDVVSYFDISDDDEEGGPFAAEERKYMPLWSHQGKPRKGNSRKALKWLGLAN
ncbi:hypothetical protein HD806DRAFT_534911 [Xylariaceae sp. AK1471]|nr:hypothetical protein HD806DRAFT_534911 [Xylariaceae sp. AK1471]